MEGTHVRLSGQDVERGTFRYVEFPAYGGYTHTAEWAGCGERHIQVGWVPCLWRVHT